MLTLSPDGGSEKEAMPIFTKESLRVLFIHIPKTGGSSVEKIFERRGWKSDLIDKGSIVEPVSTNHLRKCSPQHMHGELLRANLRLDRFDYVFTVVRNPIQRFSSEYAFRKSKDLSISNSQDAEEWWQMQKHTLRSDPYSLDNHLRPQHEFPISGTEVFRLEEGLERVARKIADLDSSTNAQLSEETEYPAVNKSWNSDTPVEISEKLKRELRSFYRKDFKKFGY